MEALATLGATGSVISIIDVATRCIRSLHALKQRWDDADITIPLLIGHMSTMKAALGQISQSTSTMINAPQHQQLVLDLEQSIASCSTVMTFIDGHVSNLMRDESNNLLFRSKARAMIQDRRVQDCISHLHNQTAALNLLLTALSWYDTITQLLLTCQLTLLSHSLAAQSTILSSRDYRQVLDRVADDSSSLICLQDATSLPSSRTQTTERSSLWKRVFSFDRDLLGTKVYQKQFRSLTKYAFRKRGIAEATPRNPTADLEHEWRKSHRQIGSRPMKPSGLAILLGPDQRGKLQLLDNLQRYHDPEQYLNRHQSYGKKILTRTCQEFQALLKDLQLHINLLDFEDIDNEVRYVLDYTNFFEAVELPGSLLRALRKLCQHYVVKQQLYECQSLERWSSSS